MKDIFLVTLILTLTTLISNAQTISSDVYSSGGGEYENSYASISITIGEIVTETIAGETHTLTQGFQQGTIVISTIEETKSINVKANIFPNPTTNSINVIIDYKGNELFTYQISDNNGKIINDNFIKTESDTKIDLSKLAIGQYYLRIVNNTLNYSKTFKIQKIGK